MCSIVLRPGRTYKNWYSRTCMKNAADSCALVSQPVQLELDPFIKFDTFFRESCFEFVALVFSFSRSSCSRVFRWWSNSTLRRKHVRCEVISSDMLTFEMTIDMLENTSSRWRAFAGFDFFEKIWQFLHRRSNWMAWPWRGASCKRMLKQRCSIGSMRTRIEWLAAKTWRSSAARSETK